MRFGTVCIIGPGLIGGSIGLGLKRRNLAEKVIGVGHRSSSIDRALTMGAIDIGNLNPENAVKDADIVILATSVNKIIDIAKHILPCMKKNAILTDVGSTKSSIVKQITADMQNDVSFVGTHPIAGSEKRGVDYASPDLFEGSTCFITPFQSDSKPLEIITHLWEVLGARVKTISPEEHDEILAYVSHLPHLLASCLINVIEEGHLMYGATGLKDTTRVASGDPVLWRDIFDQNRDNTIKAIDQFIKELTEFRKDLLTKNDTNVFERLKRAKLLRDSVFHNNSTDHEKKK